MPPLVPEVVSPPAADRRPTRPGPSKLQDQAASQPVAVAEVTRAEARQHFRQAGADGERLADAAAGDAALRGRPGRRRRTLPAAARAIARPPASIASSCGRTRRSACPRRSVGLGESLLGPGRNRRRPSRRWLAAATTFPRTRPPTGPACSKARPGRRREIWRGPRSCCSTTSTATPSPPRAATGAIRCMPSASCCFARPASWKRKSRVAGVDQRDEDVKKEGLKLLEQSYATFPGGDSHADRSGAALSRRRRRRSRPATGSPKPIATRAVCPRKKLTVTSIETSRLALNRQIQQELDAALARYQTLLDRPVRRTDARRTARRSSWRMLAQLLFRPGRRAVRPGAVRRGDPGLFRRHQPLSARARVAGSLRADRHLLPAARSGRTRPAARSSRPASCSSGFAPTPISSAPRAGPPAVERPPELAEDPVTTLNYLTDSPTRRVWPAWSRPSSRSWSCWCSLPGGSWPWPRGRDRPTC